MNTYNEHIKVRHARKHAMEYHIRWLSLIGNRIRGRLEYLGFKFNEGIPPTQYLLEWRWVWQGQTKVMDIRISFGEVSCYKQKTGSYFQPAIRITMYDSMSGAETHQQYDLNVKHGTDDLPLHVSGPFSEAIQYISDMVKEEVNA